MFNNYGDFISDQFDQVQASIQSRVAQFLTLKSTLVQLKQSSNSNIAGQASVLYNTQVKLEGLLTDNLDRLKVIQSAGLSLSAIPSLVSIGTFGSEMEKHISSVNNLSDQARGVVPVKQAGFPWGWVFLGITGAVLAGAVFKRK
jgi:hypothetical protein